MNREVVVNIPARESKTVKRTVKVCDICGVVIKQIPWNCNWCRKEVCGKCIHAYYKGSGDYRRWSYCKNCERTNKEYDKEYDALEKEHDTKLEQLEKRLLAKSQPEAEQVSSEKGENV